MNVHGIVKRFDMCVYLIAYQIDILETFLDDSIHDSSIAPFGYVAFQNRHGGGVLEAP